MLPGVVPDAGLAVSQAASLAADQEIAVLLLLDTLMLCDATGAPLTAEKAAEELPSWKAGAACVPAPWPLEPEPVTVMS